MTATCHALGGEDAVPGRSSGWCDVDDENEARAAVARWCREGEE